MAIARKLKFADGFDIGREFVANGLATLRGRIIETLDAEPKARLNGHSMRGGPVMTAAKRGAHQFGFATDALEIHWGNGHFPTPVRALYRADL